MKPRSLLTQVLAVNLLLIAGTAFVATVAVDAHLANIARGRDILVLGLALMAGVLGNWLLLHRRFRPLDELISTMEQIDLSAAPRPGRRLRRAPSDEVQRLDAAFDRMITRLESERRQVGRAAIEAQERERRRIAQDLHDEVNQALTAVSLRLQAIIERVPSEIRGELIETKRLSTQAMHELLTIARQLRPTVLDDHGLLAALRSQVRDFAEQSGIEARFSTSGSMPDLAPEHQLVIYRVTQESLSNVVQHSAARMVDVQLAFADSVVLSISDDGCGFSQEDENRLDGHLGLSGMHERALAVGGRLSVWSVAGQGTRVELTIEG